MHGSGACRCALAAIAAVWVCASAAAGAPPASPAVAAGDTAASNSAGGFALATQPRPLVFPRDHAAHPDYRQEWWYVTGNLDATSGERFGFELTFFRFALQPPAAAAAASNTSAAPPPKTSAWRAREIYMAHFAVTDVAEKRFRFAQKLSRAAIGLAGTQFPPLHVWIDDWSLTAAAEATAAEWSLHATQPGYAIDLVLTPQSAPVPNGEAGLSRKSDAPADATYYYSVPRLGVRGRLLRRGETLEVQGLAWVDREWGSGGLGAAQAGWDWFALQLDDGTSLMFYALRDRDGRRDVHSAGTWVAASGEARGLANADVAIAVTSEWRNASGERYPAGWRIRVPSLALDVSVRPVLPNQELKTTPPYWEGAVDVSGERAGRPLGGRGYVELVGYAQER